MTACPALGCSRHYPDALPSIMRDAPILAARKTFLPVRRTSREHHHMRRGEHVEVLVADDLQPVERHRE
jgi:hypothetical protein